MLPFDFETAFFATLHAAIGLGFGLRGPRSGQQRRGAGQLLRGVGRAEDKARRLAEGM